MKTSVTKTGGVTIKSLKPISRHDILKPTSKKEKSISQVANVSRHTSKKDEISSSDNEDDKISLENGDE